MAAALCALASCSSLPRDPEGTLRRVGGRELTGEAFVVPRGERVLLGRLDDAHEAAHAVGRRLHDIQLVPVPSRWRDKV